MSVEMKEVSNDPMNRLRIMLNAGRVRRCHTVSTLAYHSISTHVYGTLVIAVEVCTAAHESPTGIIMALLGHDAAEAMTGDVPAPIKREHPALRSALQGAEDAFDHKLQINVALSTVEQRIVKACDVLDLMFLCAYERQLGNHHPDIDIMFGNVVRYMKDYLDIPGVQKIYNLAWNEWDHAS